MVSWTRSSASWWLRVIRTAAGYSWPVNGTASSSNRVARSRAGLIVNSCPENRTSTRVDRVFESGPRANRSRAGDGALGLDDLLGHVGHLDVLSLRHPAHPFQRVGGRAAQRVHQDALGLVNHGPALNRVAQLDG